MLTTSCKSCEYLFLASSGHFLVISNVRPVGDGAVFVEAMAMTAANSSSVIAFSNFYSVSLQSCGPFETSEISYQMLSRASLGSFPIFLSLLSGSSLCLLGMSHGLFFVFLEGGVLCCCVQITCYTNVSVSLS